MFKRIIAAVDGSKHSHRALAYAKSLADCFKAELYLVHIFPHTSDLLGYEEYEKLVARREAAGQEILQEAHQVLDRTSFEVFDELLEGPEAEAIIAVAETR
jgi:nucleotide-binding universal stress UspA family protein